MDDDNKQQGSPWDKLLDDLGAQPDESAFQRHQPPPQEIPPSVESEEADNLAEEPKATSADWNSLAESLGLEVEVPAEPAPEERTESVPAPEVDLPDGFEFVESGPEVVEVPELTEETLSSLEMPGQAAFLEEIESEPVDEPEGEAGELDLSVADDDLPPLPTQMDQAMSDTAWGESAPATAQPAASANDRSAGDEPTEGAAADDVDEDGTGISGEAARSAFDALFSDGASSWGSAFLSKPKPDESSSEPKGDSADDSFAADLGDPLSAPGTADESETETDRPKRKRSRRRRRGGKGRKPAGEGGAEAESSEATTAAGDERDERSEDDDGEPRQKPKRRRSSQRPRAAEGADDGDGESDFDEDINEGEAGLDSPTRRQRHRNIPTWSEAIGMIVDANLEQRAKSPSKPQSSRSRGGRGGRRRGGGKKPEKN